MLRLVYLKLDYRFLSLSASRFSHALISEHKLIVKGDLDDQP